MLVAVVLAAVLLAVMVYQLAPKPLVLREVVRLVERRWVQVVGQRQVQRQIVSHFGQVQHWRLYSPTQPLVVVRPLLPLRQQR